MSAPHNPWKTLGIKSIYENPWLRLEEHDVINPAGGKNLYGKICFLNQAVGVIPLDEAGNTWLVGQYRYTLDDYSWEIPEGGSPLGEDPIETARRELREETGLIAQDIQLLLNLHTSNSVTDEEGFIYLAKGLNSAKLNMKILKILRFANCPLKKPSTWQSKVKLRMP